MKIVHMVGYFVPELGYQEYYLAKKHAEAGHEVYVITSDLLYPFPNIEKMLQESGAKETSRKRKVGSSQFEGINVIRLKSFFEYSDFILCRGIRKELERIMPDVVFAHESRQGFALMAAFLKKRLGYRLIVDQHDFFHRIPNHPFPKRMLRFIDYFCFRKFIVNYSLRKADKVVAVTEDTRKFLESKHSLCKDKLVVIPLGVDTDFFRFDERKRRSIRKRLGIAGKDIVFVFSGTIVRRKGLESMIEAFSEIINEKKNKNARLIIVGAGEEDYMKELKELAASNKLGEKCIFTGFVKKKEVSDYFSAADAGIWPGNNSVSIMEAMSCGLPVLIADMQLGFLAENMNGFKFRQADKKEIIECIGRMLRSDLKLMGKKSREFISKNYSYDRIAKEFLDLN